MDQVGYFKIKQGEYKIKTFGRIEPDQIIKEDDLFMVVYDKYPVSPGHTLIFAKRPIARFLELTKEEIAERLNVDEVIVKD